MIALNLRYTIYCEPCERAVDLDMTRFPPDGIAIGRTFKCSQCGRKGSSIITHRSADHSYPGSKPYK